MGGEGPATAEQMREVGTSILLISLDSQFKKKKKKSLNVLCQHSRFLVQSEDSCHHDAIPAPYIHLCWSEDVNA